MAPRYEPDEYFNDKDLPLEEDMDDKDSPLAGDLDEEDEALGEMICPSCRGIVTEDTQKCPHCGDWITPEHASRHGWRRWVFVAAVLLTLWALLRWMGVL
ncbi:MAG TPA: hypothetical protein VMV94_04570 [Phycisphaerae bacterium]|nr:hypothetical protein [Phycisphaerae bacterium]